MEYETITREEALADPARVNDLISQLTGMDQTMPVIPDAPGDLITISGLHYNGKVFKTARVKELTGSDEEALSRAMKSNNGFHFMDTLLNRGVTHVGDQKATSDMLQNMLLGDRDELLIQIRIATYGDEFVLEGWACPMCGGQTDIAFSLANDIERIPLSDFDGGEPSFEMDLRRGAKALVRFPTGADQLAMSDPAWTVTERNSEMLRRCVKSITRADGSEIHVQAFPAAIAEMNIPDRHRIVEEINNRMPGPRYTMIGFNHAECQKDVKLALSMLDIFRELLLGF